MIELKIPVILCLREDIVPCYAGELFKQKNAALVKIKLVFYKAPQQINMRLQQNNKKTWKYYALLLFIIAGICVCSYKSDYGQ